jgi:hypothetical protein
MLKIIKKAKLVVSLQMLEQSELTKLAERGIESPTGLIEDLLTPLQKLASELGLGEDEKKIESLITKVKGKTNLNQLTSRRESNI